MLVRFGDANSGEVANMVAGTCAFGPNAVVDYGRPLRLAEQAVASDPRNADCMNTLGTVLYRAGRFEAAVQRLNQSIALQGQGGTVWDWLFLAMAHHRLGHPEEARRWFEKAVPVFEQALRRKAEDPRVFSPWTGYFPLMQAVRREAEGLLKSSHP
jgi:tetratricopeptide (TPR) repeat protein